MFIIHLWSILKQFRERKHLILLRVVELITFTPLSFGCSGIWGGGGGGIEAGTWASCVGRLEAKTVIFCARRLTMHQIKLQNCFALPRCIDHRFFPNDYIFSLCLKFGPWYNFMQPYERKYSILKVADLILCTTAITFSFGVSFQLNSYATMFISIGLIGLVYHQCAAVNDSLSDLHVGMHYNNLSQVSWRLNHQELDGVFSSLTRQTSKNIWSLLITGLLRGETVTKSS